MRRQLSDVTRNETEIELNEMNEIFIMRLVTDKKNEIRRDEVLS